MTQDYLEYLNQNLEEIEERITENFLELDFEDGRHPKEQVDFVDEIEVQVEEVEITNISVLNQEENTVSFRLDASITFLPKLSFADQDTAYYDDEEEEYKTLETVTIESDLQTCKVPVEVTINIDKEEEVTEVESVHLKPNGAIKVTW
ncbi:MAG: hypothetical protein HC836_49350 [Richelia sp. RM2_1_2]|nr:hypothetical protein [Richelia sp. RM2_1_2]